jgi:hypothetical protein
LDHIAASKNGNSEGATGSKSKMDLMKSYKNSKKDARKNQYQKWKTLWIQ